MIAVNPFRPRNPFRSTASPANPFRAQTAAAVFAPPEIDHKALSPDLLASIDASQRPQMERADASRVAPQPEKTAPVSREIPFTAQSDASSVARKPSPPSLPSSGKIGPLEERNVGGKDLIKPLPGEPDPLKFMPGQGAIGALEGPATFAASYPIEGPRSLLRTGALVQNLVQGQSVRDAFENANPLAEESAKILDPINRAIHKAGNAVVGEPQTDFERQERDVVGPLVGGLALGGATAKIKALRAARAAKDVPVAEPVAPEVQPDKWDAMASVQRQQARVADMGDVADQLDKRQPVAPGGVTPAPAQMTEPVVKGATPASSDAATLYSGIPLKAITRPVSAAALAVGGEKLSENDNPELAATGRGIMALAAFHAVGAKRFASVGRSVGRTLVDKLPAGLIEKINPDALLTPEVRGAIHQYERDVSFSKARAKEMGGKARQLGPEGDRKVSDVIEGEHFQAPLDPQTTEKVLATAAEISNEFTRQGRAKVKAGLLPEQAVAKREGAYLPRKYAEHEVPDAQSGVPSGTTAKMRIGAEHTRQDLTPEVRNKLGEIREASYRAEAGLEKGGKDLAAARLFETLRASPDAMHPDFVNASDALKAAKLANNPQGILDAQRALKALKDAHSTKAGEWVTLPDTRGLGPLRGAVVRREVANSINGIPEIGGAGGSLLRYWKRVHTVWNPGTHVGNFFSNVSLAHLAGLPAWEQPIALARAAKELRVYGPNARALTEAGVLDANIATTTAEGAGQVGRTATSRLRELARTTRPETAGKLAEKGIQPMSGIEKGARKLDQKVGTLYNNEDNVFRVALYRKAVMRAEQGGLGMAPRDAAEYVRKSLIDYRTRSPLLNWMRNTVSPFVLFPAKALPLVAGQIVEHPWRWITLAATWGSLDQYSQQKVGRIPDEDLAARDKRSPVGYLMPGTTQLPMTNPQGDKYAMDVSRYTPLNALTSNAPPGATTTALSPSFPSGLTPSGPFVDAAARLANTDPFTGDKMLRPSDTGRDIAKKLTIGKMGPGAFQPGVLAQMALPSALSFHAPRVATDLANDDTQAAKVDALGIVGMRPKVIRAGQETDRTMYGYHKEAEDLRQQMRQDLRKAKSTAAKISIFTDAKKKQTALMRRYEQSKAEAGR